MARNQVFISYSHKDKNMLEDLQTMLVPLIKTEGLLVWDDTQINVGDSWRHEIDTALEKCAVAVMLVSPHFLASRFISDVELPALLEGAESNQLRVCWILVSDCLYNSVPKLSKFQAAHDLSRPLDTLKRSKKNSILAKIAQTIHKQYKSVLAGQKEASSTGISIMNNSEMLNYKALDKKLTHATTPAQNDVSPPDFMPDGISKNPSNKEIIARIEKLHQRDRFSAADRNALITLFTNESDYTEQEVAMPPQEMNQVQIAEIYQNSTNSVIHYLSSIMEKQAEFIERSPLPGDPQTEEMVNLLKRMQHQIALVATIAKVYSPHYYEIYEFESNLLSGFIGKLKETLLSLDNFLIGNERPPDDVQMKIENEFDNLIFGAGRILLLIQEIRYPKNHALKQ